MDPISAQSWVMIISAIATGIAAIIAAWKSTKSNVIAKDNSEKLNTLAENTQIIQTQTNGNLTEAKTKLKVSEARNDYLLKVITKMAEQLPEGTVDKVMLELDAIEAKIGHRRKEDIFKEQ